MTRTSPARPLDIPALFPGISAFAKTATRLHPRPGDPGIRDSHIGGMVLWPAAEPWPTCHEPHVVPTETPIPRELAEQLNRSMSPAVMAQLAAMTPGFAGLAITDDRAYIAGSTTVTQPTPLVPVAQLRATDIPDLRCPSGTDTLQVLWCPNEHGDAHDFGPAVQIRWRASGSVTEALPAAPPAAAHKEIYLPRPCVLHPEQIVEYPWWQELPEELGRQVDEFDQGRQYGEYDYYAVSQAPGWKVAGYPNWAVSDLKPMNCTGCGTSMDLLLTIDSTESMGLLWLPVEDSGLQPDRTDPAWIAAHEPTGISVGRHSQLRIFICPTCPDTPIRPSIQ
ncbi:hypothetical protein [Krasilnikovia sp. MM14-A1004]|uniref:hypothetical protein n=1 Tax=Krasilnikovia sp. MM14-A1004 TaxID=3373541 RepID=UPI00399D3E7C